MKAFLPLRRKPVTSLRRSAMSTIRVLVESRALSVSKLVVAISEQADNPAQFRDAAVRQYLQLFQQYIFTQVIAQDTEEVADEVLAGVECALTAKKKLYSRNSNNINVVVFSNEVNLVVRFIELVCIQQLKKLDLEKIPRILRTDLLINLSRFEGIQHLNLGYGSGNPERMDRFYSEGLPKLTQLAHFTLRRNCTDRIIELLQKGCIRTLQVLDVEGSRDVTDCAIQFIVNFRLRELNIFNCCISNRGLAGVLQLSRNLLVLHRGMGLCEALAYQVLVDETNFFANPRKLKLEVFQPSEKLVFHSNADMDLVANACPNIKKMIFKYNEDFFLDYHQLAIFDKLQHFETWGGEFRRSNLNKLLEIIGQNLVHLSLFHVEAMDYESVILVAKYCGRLVELKYENCSFSDNTTDGDDEAVDNPEVRNQMIELFDLRMPLMMDMKVLTIASEMPLQMMLMILKKVLNIKVLHINTDNDIMDNDFTQLLEFNKLDKMEEILVTASRHLTLQTVHLLLSSCPRLSNVRYMDVWRAVTKDDLETFRDWIKEDNIHLDTGEKEMMEERRRWEEELLEKERAKQFCSGDILSKMFGPAYQEGEGHREGEQHLLDNPFPQEGEGIIPM